MKRVTSRILLRTLAASVVLLGLAAPASAIPMTWSSTTTGLTDMEHQRAFTWRIDNINIDSTAITGATLKFNNFRNWTSATNDPYNVLFVDLLNTSTYSGVTSAVDNTNTGTLGKGDIADAFRTTGLSTRNLSVVGTGTGKLVASGTGITYVGSSYNPTIAALTSTERAAIGYDTNLDTGHRQGSSTLAGPFGTTAVNWQLDFGSTAIASLKSYLAGADNTIAIGLDADCHFYDSSIVLEIYYDQPSGGTAVPEPGTMLLVGSGLIAAYRRRKQLLPGLKA